MSTLTRTVTPSVDIPSQYIRIKKGRGIDARFQVLTFIDKETKQHIVFCPAFDLTGYGSTIEKAYELFNFNLDQFYEELYDLTYEKQNAMLIKLGWKKDKFKNKNYSSVFVNVHGELENFNIEEGTLKLQSVTLEAA